MNVVATHLWHPPAEKKIHLQKNKRPCQIGRKINKKIISITIFIERNKMHIKRKINIFLYIENIID